MNSLILIRAILAIDAAYKLAPTSEEYVKNIQTGINALRAYANTLENNPVGNCKIADSCSDALFLIKHG